MAVLQSGSRSMCMKYQCTKLSFPFGGMSFAISASVMGGGFGAGIVLHREFPKEKTPLRSVARAKEPDAYRRRADKARRRQVTDLEPEGRRTGAEESRGLFFGGKPQRKEVVEESGGGLVKRLQPRLATTLFGRRAQ